MAEAPREADRPRIPHLMNPEAVRLRGCCESLRDQLEGFYVSPEKGVHFDAERLAKECAERAKAATATPDMSDPPDQSSSSVGHPMWTVPPLSISAAALKMTKLGVDLHDRSELEAAILAKLKAENAAWNAAQNEKIELEAKVKTSEDLAHEANKKLREANKRLEEADTTITGLKASLTDQDQMLMTLMTAAEECNLTKVALAELRAKHEDLWNKYTRFLESENKRLKTVAKP